MCAAAARADFCFVHGLDDFLGAKFLDSTCPGKGKIIQVKLLYDTKGPRFALSALIVLGLKGGTFSMVLGEFIPNQFNSYVHGRQPTSKSIGICFVAVIQIFHVLIEKFEHNRTADVIRV